MSIPFSATSTKNGHIQIAEARLGLDDGAISNNALLLARFCAGFNNTIDYIYAKIFAISKWTWQHDDTNKTRTNGYPVATINLVSGTATYALTADTDNNAIVDIHKIFVTGPDGVVRELERRNVTADADSSVFTDGQSHLGTPTAFSQTGKYIKLTPTPNYNATGGLMAIVSSEGTYFVVGDTTAKAGIAVCQEYISLRYIAQYAADHTMANAATLAAEADKLEAAILYHYGQRGPKGGNRMSANVESNK